MLDTAETDNNYTGAALTNDIQYSVTYYDKLITTKNFYLPNGEIKKRTTLQYHDQFEKRSLLMDFNIHDFKSICILDTETTDRYWNTAAPIQIAAVIVNTDGKIIDSFNERIKTTHTIAPDASAVHGIYQKDLVNCRRESEVLGDFCV